MNADPVAVQKIFAQAVAIADPNQRLAFVREQCAQDAELLRRVEALSGAYDEPKAYFDQPTAQLANPPASAPMVPAEASHQPGSVVAGRYKLLEAIGEGGMGTVWVAEQTSPVRRKVALKLVKPGMDSKLDRVTRFRAETDQASRWLSYALLEAERGGRKIVGYDLLPSLITALGRSPVPSSWSALAFHFHRLGDENGTRAIEYQAQ